MCGLIVARRGTPRHAASFSSLERRELLPLESSRKESCHVFVSLLCITSATLYRILLEAPQYIASPMVALFSHRAGRREDGFPFFFGETSSRDGVFREIDIPFDISRFYPSRFSEQRTKER